MPDVISDTNGKLCVGSYHMWRLLSNPDNYSLTISQHALGRGLYPSMHCAEGRVCPGGCLPWVSVCNLFLHTFEKASSGILFEKSL